MKQQLKMLKRGDTLGIIAPSFAADMTSERIVKFKEYFEARGINLVFGETCYAKHGYLAGTDELRSSEINKMFADNSINAIIAIKGGYGASRIVDKVDYEIIRKNPKLFIGFSDITIFLNSINQLANIPTIHGQVGIFLGHPKIDQASIDDFDKLIFTKQKGRILESLNDTAETLVSGKVTGELIGGNLSLIATLVGTNYDIDFTDKIVFIEEIEEQPYQIDRYLSRIRLAGALEKAKGFVFGYFTDCMKEDAPKDAWTVKDVLSDYVLSLNKPTIFNFSSGHDFPFVNLPIGLQVELDADKKTIKILEELYKD